MEETKYIFQKHEGLKWVIIIMMITILRMSKQTFSLKNYDTAQLNRSLFPQGFIFGASSSAYQYEGAAVEDGRGPSIWDTYSHKYPGKIKDGSNGDLAVDFYHRYKEDVKIIKEMGLDAYRFLISWSRVLPKGKLSGGVNREGIQFYNNLINELLNNGIKPFVTITWRSSTSFGRRLWWLLKDDFRDYSELCFREFGDRVKQWMTLNEPLYYTITGYASGNGPPGRCSEWLHLNCSCGDSGTEPYIVGHNQILAHAAAVRLYRKKYKASQKGEIGIVLATPWFVPLSRSVEDYDAAPPAQRVLDFMIGWFMEPLTRGKYPCSMSRLVKDLLPKFTRKQSRMVKGSFDFMGLNYYSSSYAANAILPNGSRYNYLTDSHANLTSERHGFPIGPKTAVDGTNVYPRGIQDLLLYMKKKYKAQAIYITQNGICEANNDSLSL